MEPNTTIFKGREGWEAKTTIVLGPGSDGRDVGTRVLEITTSKYNGAISTNAYAHLETATSKIWIPTQDFRRNISRIKLRATEKSITEEHNLVLRRDSAELTAAALAHYGLMPEAEAA